MVGTSLNKYEELEDRFSEYAGYDYGVACNSGTSALTLALASIGVGPGDEVIVPEFTMIACAWAVSYLGATPVFVDCGNDMNIDVRKMQLAITPRTKAVMPVHIYGRICNMKAVMKVADAFGLYVVEDRSEIAGKVEPKGHIACYSLYRNKIVSSQEGGVLVTDDLKIKKAADDLKNMAFGEDHDYYHCRMGFNMRMPEAQAELALKSLANVENELEDRRAWEKECNEAFKEEFEEGWMWQLPDRDSVWVYDFVCKHKNELVEYVKSKGGQIRHAFKPMSMQPMYKREFNKLKAYQYSLVGAYLPYGADTKLVKEFYVQKRQTVSEKKPPSNRNGANRNSNKKSARG